MKLILITLLYLTNTFGYMLNRLPIGNHIFSRELLDKIDNYNLFNNSFKKYNSKLDNNNLDNDKKIAIFLPTLTGNVASSGLYENFINIMTKKAFDIYIPNNDLQSIFDDINNTELDITLIAHSASAMTGINISNNIDSIKTLILIDPLDINNKDNPPLQSIDYEIEDINAISKNTKEDQQIYIDNLEKILFINTERSNDWSIIPFIFPIGMLSLKPERLSIGENVTQEFLKADDFGHFDILDDKWSNIIHNTISRGCKDRDSMQLELFRAWIVNKINNITI